MSEARNTRPVREVPNQDNVASRLAELDNAYWIYVSDSTSGLRRPIMYHPRFVPGPGMSQNHARLLNSFHSKNAALAAGLKLAKHKGADEMGDSAKVEFLTRAVADYEFTDEIGAEFAHDLRQQAATRIVNSLTGGKSYTPARVAEAVTKILGDPSVADKYTDRVRSEAAAILSDNKPMQKRGARAETSEDDSGAIEI